MNIYLAIDIGASSGRHIAAWREGGELKMKEIRGTKSRCILENATPISDKCVCCGKEAKHLVVWGIQY